MQFLPPRKAHRSCPLSLEMLPLSSIKDNPHNPRGHDRKQLAKLARSIQRFGFITPVVVDENGELLCGHARVLAARQLDIQAVPAVRACHLSEAKKRAYVIADNRLAELASWNAKSLKRELEFLNGLDIDYDFSALGFDTADIDFILADGDEVNDRADALPKTCDVPTVSRPGDLWQLEQHRLYCGSALESASYQRLLEHDRAHMVFTDPPYNVPSQGHACGAASLNIVNLRWRPVN